MQEITSVLNNKIKNIIKLKQKKYREEQGLILIEGYKIFLEAEKTNQKIVEIFATKKEFEKNNLSKYQNLLTLISDNVSEKLSFNQTSQNFFAVIKQPEKLNFSGNFLILDNIQDPQNLGAIIRTSVACDCKKLYLINCVDEFNDKVVRASMGNVFKVDCEHIGVNDLSKVCNNIPFGLILGNEGNGVSAEVKSFATKTIKIPMQNDVESLNVAVSCGIILYNLKF